MSISCTGRICAREICDPTLFLKLFPPLAPPPHTHSALRSTRSFVRAPLVFGLSAFGVLVFACAPRPHGNETTARSSGAAANAKSSKTDGPRVESSLAVNVGSRTEGTTGVNFDFKVMNAGAGKVEMQFPTGQTHEVVVIDSLGHEVWRWSRGRLFTKLLQNKILRGADTLAFDGTWRSAPSGKYVAVAKLASANYPIEQRTSFDVP